MDLQTHSHHQQQQQQHLFQLYCIPIRTLHYNHFQYNVDFSNATVLDIGDLKILNLAPMKKIMMIEFHLNLKNERLTFKSKNF